MWDKLQPVLQKGDFDAAREMTSKDNSYISQLLSVGFERQGVVRRREDFEIAMDEVMMSIVPQLEKRTPYTALFANLATLMGLLGTILGLIAAFAVLGVMYNLHVISVNFVLGMFMFDALFEWEKIGLKNIAAGLILFALAALPVVLWKLNGPPTNFSLRPDWLTLVANSSHYNLFYLLAPYPTIMIATAGGIGALALFVIAHRAAPATPQEPATSAVGSDG